MQCGLCGDGHAFSAVLDPETKAFLPNDQLKKLFEEKGVDPSKPIISSCGTGVTAVVIETALEEAGFGPSEKRKVYDDYGLDFLLRGGPPPPEPGAGGNPFAGAGGGGMPPGFGGFGGPGGGGSRTFHFSTGGGSPFGGMGGMPGGGRTRGPPGGYPF